MKKHHVWGIAVLVIMLFVDLWTKNLISADFHLGESKSIIDQFFSLTLVHNKGAAFGMGYGQSKYFFIIVTSLASLYMFWLFVKLPIDAILGSLGLGLILSGALGNLIDRIRLGYVVDFLDFYIKSYHWPAFNVADVSITIGAVLYGIYLLKTSPVQKEVNGAFE